MVNQPALNDGPNIRDTNIDQSILFELFKIEQNYKERQMLDQNSAVMNGNRRDEIEPIEDFEEKEEDPEMIRNCEYGNLPDLSEYEKWIDWDELPNVENRTEGEPTPSI